MDRQSTKHGPREDEALKNETEPMVRSNRPAHTEEWRDPEPPADDDPEVRGWHPHGPAEDDERRTDGLMDLQDLHSKRAFTAARLDETVHELEAGAPEGSGARSGSPDGPLAVAQRHRAEVDTADEDRIDAIIRAHPDIAEAWRQGGRS